MPTPRPTPSAVVLVFFSGSAAGVPVGVDEALATAVGAPLDPDAEADAPDVVATDNDVEDAAEVWVCVNDSPMIVTVYTSAGDWARVKISNPELVLQSQPSKQQ
jgi:hypothetical protein